MAILQRIETTHYIYEYELTDEELELYETDEDAFWEQMDDDGWSDPDMDVDSTPIEYKLIK